MIAALAVVSAIAAILGTVVIWLGYRDSRRNNARKQSVEEIKAIVHEEIKAFVDKQQEQGTRVDGVITRQQETTGDLHELADKMGRVLDRLAVMETKIEVFWRSVAMDAAKIIHSPDPRRAHIDELLDAFMGGSLTTEQAAELRKILVFLRDWEPGKPANFPVYPGEQVAAAILLRTMDHALASGSKHG